MVRRRFQKSALICLATFGPRAADVHPHQIALPAYTANCTIGD
jgi:hypothetical protein